MPYWDIILSSLTSAVAGPAARPSAAVAAARSFQGFIACSSYSCGVSGSYAVLGFGADGSRQPARRRVDEPAQVGPGLARVDDLLHAEGLGGAEGRGVGAQLGL